MICSERKGRTYLRAQRPNGIAGLMYGLKRVCGSRKKTPQISPLRYAPVEMTNCWRDEILHFQERSAELQIPRLPPDFLSRVAASVNCMWFSLGRTTYVVAGESGEVGNPGTLLMTTARVARRVP
jgi:hypothetical protein